MKPFTSGSLFAAWLLRIMLAWFVYHNYFQTFADFDLNNFSFYISGAYLLFTVLLIAGGFMRQEGLTVISGLAIFVLPIIQLVRDFPEEISGVMLLYLIPLSVGFTFFTTGNNH
jgi:hypothetical protein